MFSRYRENVIKIGQFYGKATRYFKEFENSPNRDKIIEGMISTIKECTKSKKPFSCIIDIGIFRINSSKTGRNTILNKLEDMADGYEYLASQINCNVTMRDIFVEPDEGTSGFTLIFREKDNLECMPAKVSNIIQLGEMSKRIREKYKS